MCMMNDRCNLIYRDRFIEIMIKVIFVLSDFSGILYFPARMDDLLKHKMTAVYAIFVYMLLIVTHEYVYFLYRFFVQLSRTIFFLYHPNLHKRCVE